MPIPKITKEFKKTAFKNLFMFLQTLAFTYIFMYLFGEDNVLAAVALGVAFTMFPSLDLHIKPASMFLIIVGLFTLGGCVSQLAHGPIWLAVPCYFFYLLLLLVIGYEPAMFKPFMPFLINFVFCQSTPVADERFLNRFLCLFLGSIFVGLFTYIQWKRNGFGKDGNGIREQIRIGQKSKSYLFRMAFGVTFAMFTGSILHLKKPLWISIVVMSLTQIEFSETLERIKHRFIGTMIGIVVFFIFLQLLIPKEYAIFFILSLGYLSYFLPQYKYTSIINAVNALNASLVLLDTKEAISNRIILLIAGIFIVLIVAALAALLKKIKLHFKIPFQKQCI